MSTNGPINIINNMWSRKLGEASAGSPRVNNAPDSLATAVTLMGLKYTEAFFNKIMHRASFACPSCGRACNTHEDPLRKGLDFKATCKICGEKMFVRIMEEGAGIDQELVFHEKVTNKNRGQD
jgi:transcription elongation factor Elf1